MPKVVHNAAVHGQRQLELLNCQMPLSVTKTIEINNSNNKMGRKKTGTKIKDSNAAVQDNGN